MRLRQLVTVACLALAVAGCGKKGAEPAKTTQEPAKVATAEPAKEPTKEPEKPAKPAEPEKPAEPAKPAEPEKPAEPAKAMTPADVKAKFDELMQLAFSEPDKVAGLYADDAVTGLTDAPETLRTGGAGAVEFYQRTRSIYPDFKVEPQLVLVGSDRVLAVVLATGTQTGEIKPGVAPTGKKIGIIGAVYVQWGPDGKIKSDRHFVDQTAIRGQLGLMPPNTPFRPLLEKGVAEPVVVLQTGSQGEKDLVAHHQKEQVAFNAKDMKAMADNDAMTADDIVFFNATMPADIVGKEAFNKAFEAMLKANPDVRAEGDDIWAAGDYCVHQSRMSATNSGEMVMGDMKMPATNKPWAVDMLEIEHFEGGKLKQFSLFSNGLAMAKQLGLVPADAPKPDAPKEEAPKDAPKTP